MQVSKKIRRLQLFSVALAIFGLADSLYLLSFKFGGSLVCGVGSCEAVNTSPYSMLLGVPVAAIGVAGYALLVGVGLWAWLAQDNAPAWLPDVRLLLTSGGVFFAAYLTGLELFVIHAICMWCMFQATAILIMFILQILERRASNAEEQGAVVSNQ